MATPRLVFYVFVYHQDYIQGGQLYPKYFRDDNRTDDKMPLVESFLWVLTQNKVICIAFYVWENQTLFFLYSPLIKATHIHSPKHTHTQFCDPAPQALVAESGNSAVWGFS